MKNNWKKELREKLKPLNGVILVCPRCHKVDVSQGHEEKCNPMEEAQRQMNMEYYK